MKAEFLEEPELEFGVDKHIDIRFGLMNYGPVDYASSIRPREIKLGIVGTNETIEGLNKWLERCRDEIPAKPSNQPNLFPKFPGFRSDDGFYSTLILDSKLQREIPSSSFTDMRKNRNLNQVIKKAVELFLVELDYLVNKTTPDVLMCALPQELLELTGILTSPVYEESMATEDEIDDEETEEEEGYPLDFHHLLKAKAMRLKIPIQLIIPSTYDYTYPRKLDHKLRWNLRYNKYPIP